MPVRAFLGANPGVGGFVSDLTVDFTGSGAVAGDVAVVVTSISNTSAITAPAGFPLKSGPDNVSSNLVTNLYVRDLTSGDLSSSFTWHAANGGRFIGACLILSSCTSTGMLVGGPNLDTTADTTLVPPNLTTSGTPANWDIIGVWALRVGSATAATVTVPATHTKDGEITTATGTTPNWTVGLSHRTGGGMASTTYGTSSGTASASVTDILYTIAVPNTSVNATATGATATVSVRAAAGAGNATNANPPAATARVTAKALAPPPLYRLAAFYTALGGVFVRPGPSGGTPPAGTPTAPQNFRATMTGTTATLTWTTPASDNGAAITGYTVINVTTGAVQNLGVTLSTTFTGLTAGAAYRFSCAAVNSAGTGAAATASVSAATAARFPGDPRSKVTGRWYFGLIEGDQDPTRITFGERAAPETLAGVPTAGMRFYKLVTSDASAVVGPGAPARSFIADMQSHGRLPFPTISFGNWAAASDGRNDTTLYNFIAYVEETLSGPVWFAPPHEPENNTGNGTEADWGRIAKNYRQQMNAYAAAHGGVGVYKWKNFALGFIFTAYGFKQGDKSRAAGPFWRAAAYTTGVTATASSDVFTASNHMLSDGCRVQLLNPPSGLSAGTDYYLVSTTSNTFKLAASRGGSAANVAADGTGITVVYHDIFDFACADGYQQPLDDSQPVGRTGAPMWQPNNAAFVAWCEDPAHTYPMLFAETGVHKDDADAGTQLSIFYNKCLDGTHDIIGMFYFNSNAGTTRDPSQWALMNTRSDGGSNAKLLDVYIAFMKDRRSIHFWDTTQTDGTPYPRPAGV